MLFHIHQLFFIYCLLFFFFLAYFKISSLETLRIHLFLCHVIINYQNKSQLLFDDNVVLVTAYFPLPRSKYTHTKYNNWIKSFLNIINCKIIIYTTFSFYNIFYKKEISCISQDRRAFFNFNFTFNDIFELPCLKNISNDYMKINRKDRENKLHNPYLYAIWNGKICFLQEATFIYSNHSFFFWIDSGCVREKIYTNFFEKNGKICDQSIDCLRTSECHNLHFPDTYFSKSILNYYNSPPLEICLFFVSNHVFSSKSNIKTIKNIAEGIFFGSRMGIHKFYKAFWEVHSQWLEKNIFCGKDQEIYNYVFSHYFNQINFYVFPAYKASSRGNTWFRYLSAFSKENPYNASNRLLPYYLFIN